MVGISLRIEFSSLSYLMLTSPLPMMWSPPETNTLYCNNHQMKYQIENKYWYKLYDIEGSQVSVPGCKWFFLQAGVVWYALVHRHTPKVSIWWGCVRRPKGCASEIHVSDLSYIQVLECLYRPTNFWLGGSGGHLHWYRWSEHHA